MNDTEVLKAIIRADGLDMYVRVEEGEVVSVTLNDACDGWMTYDLQVPTAVKTRLIEIYREVKGI